MKVAAKAATIAGVVAVLPLTASDYGPQPIHWDEPANYTFEATYQWGDHGDTVRIVVIDHQVAVVGTHDWYVGYWSPESLESGQTLAEILSRYNQTEAKDPACSYLALDPATGVPTIVDIDFCSSVVDGGQDFTIVSFNGKPLATPDGPHVRSSDLIPATWEEPADYTYTYHLQAGRLQTQLTVTVRDHEVVAVQWPRYDRPFTLADVVADYNAAIREDRTCSYIVLDPDTGVPVRVSIDYCYGYVDGGQSYDITNVETEGSGDPSGVAASVAPWPPPREP